MNRFQRLVDLRQIKEEVAAAGLSKAIGLMDQIQKTIRELDQETESARQTAQNNFGPQEDRLPPEMVENFIKGQKWRREKLLAALEQAKKERAVAQEQWKAARVALKQSEKLAEIDDKRRLLAERKQEALEMDMAGILRHQRNA
ncbi:MAG: flagellar export protein FliJ [Magnetococcales bacterium]|nr:flagellar export protein FliJ [Magnetococcales bacterium]